MKWYATTLLSPTYIQKIASSFGIKPITPEASVLLTRHLNQLLFNAYLESAIHSDTDNVNVADVRFAIEKNMR